MTPLAKLTLMSVKARMLFAQNASILEPMNARGAGWFNVTNADSPERAQVYVYDTIGWDTPASDFVKEVNAITAPVIDVRINSGGGFVWDGIDMYAALKEHPSRVEVAVTGIAASAASVVAMAADHIAVEKAAKMMIHRSSGGAWGNMHDLREVADVLQAIDDSAAEIYQARAGGPVDAWLQAMDKTTWYKAQEAVDAKLADAVIDNKTKTPEPPPEDRASQMIRARARVYLGKGQ